MPRPILWFAQNRPEILRCFFLLQNALYRMTVNISCRRLFILAFWSKWRPLLTAAQGLDMSDRAVIVSDLSWMWSAAAQWPAAAAGVECVGWADDAVMRMLATLCCIQTHMLVAIRCIRPKRLANLQRRIRDCRQTRRTNARHVLYVLWCCLLCDGAFSSVWWFLLLALSS